MSFYADEIVLIEDAELFLLGASVADLGYEEMLPILRYSILAIKDAQNALRRGKMPGQP